MRVELTAANGKQVDVRWDAVPHVGDHVFADVIRTAYPKAQQGSVRTQRVTEVLWFSTYVLVILETDKDIES